MDGKFLNKQFSSQNGKRLLSAMRTRCSQPVWCFADGCQSKKDPAEGLER